MSGGVNLLMLAAWFSNLIVNLPDIDLLVF